MGQIWVSEIEYDDCFPLERISVGGNDETKESTREHGSMDVVGSEEAFHKFLFMVEVS